MKRCGLPHCMLTSADTFPTPPSWMSCAAIVLIVARIAAQAEKDYSSPACRPVNDLVAHVRRHLCVTKEGHVYCQSSKVDKLNSALKHHLVSAWPFAACKMPVRILFAQLLRGGSSIWHRSSKHASTSQCLDPQWFQAHTHTAPCLTNNQVHGLGFGCT